MDISNLKKFSASYLELISGKYSTINLTRILDPEEFYTKQILDSILPFSSNEYLKNVLRGTKRVLDIGFGGGAPILPLAFLNPHIKFFGIEARAKKVKVVSEIADILGIKNINLVHGRVEDFLINKNCVVTFKAVGTIEQGLSSLNLGPAVEVIVCFYKGPSVSRDEAVFLKSTKNWEYLGIIEVEVPTTEGRSIVAFKTNHPTSLKNLKKLKPIFE